MLPDLYMEKAKHFPAADSFLFLRFFKNIVSLRFIWTQIKHSSPAFGGACRT